MTPPRAHPVARNRPNVTKALGGAVIRRLGTAPSRKCRAMDVSRSPLDSLYDHDRFVLLTELLRAHPELLPEAETIATTLLIADERQIEKDVADKLRSLRVSARRLGARSAAADVGIGVMLGAYDCREETSEDLVLTRAGLPDAADNLARSVYKVLQAKHLTLPGLTDECPQWDWYLESWSGYLSVPGVLDPCDDLTVGQVRDTTGTNDDMPLSIRRLRGPVPAAADPAARSPAGPRPWNTLPRGARPKIG